MGMEIQKIDTTQTQSPPKTGVSPEEESQTKRMVLFIGIGVAVALIILIGFIIFLFLSPANTVAQIRDVFIILMALMSLLVGFVLVLLVFQLARLTNLLNNEIKPILESMNETVSTLRGTTTFLSDNLVEPVIKMNEYLAALQQVLTVLGLARRKSKKQT